MPSVSVRELSLNFGDVQVLRNLNLDIEEGEFLVLLGPSGCGKSTLLNCIAGLLDASDGQIFIKDRNVTWEEPKDRGIGSSVNARSECTICTPVKFTECCHGVNCLID